MDNFKKASQLKLRFNTDRGALTTEQLWGLTLTQLTFLIRAIKKVLKQTENDDDLAFLVETSQTDPENQLRFEIAKDIYISKKAEKDEAQALAIAKENDQKILAIIARKQDNKLDEMSIEDLEKLLSKK